MKRNYATADKESKTTGIAGGLRKPPKRGLKIEITLFSRARFLLVLYVFPDFLLV
jgi:hypothetical protein